MHPIRRLELYAPLMAAPAPVGLIRDESLVEMLQREFQEYRRLSANAIAMWWHSTVQFARETYDSLRGKMLIYATAEKMKRLHVKPGQNPESDPADWYEDEQKTRPIQFNVVFVGGRAEVPDTLGKFLVAQGLAKRTSLIMPARRQVA